MSIFLPQTSKVWDYMHIPLHPAPKMVSEEQWRNLEHVSNLGEDGIPVLEVAAIVCRGRRSALTMQAKGGGELMVERSPC